jgi:acylphosphatase
MIERFWLSQPLSPKLSHTLYRFTFYAFTPSPSMDLIRAHVWISGQVQGVAYRVSAAKIATHLGLVGWVRNLPDGRVEAIFEGEEAAVESMLRWCHEGPPEAIVEQVRASYETPEGLQSFNIRR